MRAIAVRSVIVFALLLLAAACAEPRPDTHDNFDAWQKSLKGVPERTLIIAMGKIPDGSFQLDQRTRILQWRWDTSYITKGVPPDYRLVNGVWVAQGGVAPQLVKEGCIAEWFVEDGRAARYRWEGWACRAHPPAAPQIVPPPPGD